MKLFFKKRAKAKKTSPAAPNPPPPPATQDAFANCVECGTRRPITEFKYQQPEEKKKQTKSGPLKKLRHSKTTIVQERKYRCVAPPAACPGKKAPTRHLCIFDLSQDVLVHILSILDCASAFQLKISCKRFYTTLPDPSHPASKADKMLILRSFPPRNWFNGDRAPPYLCEDCVLWHSFEHLVVYPHPVPESVFLEYRYFAAVKRRACARFAIESTRWTLGRPIDDKGLYILCSDCKTPKDVKKGLCQWNCTQCGGCTGRASWSTTCQSCSLQPTKTMERAATSKALVGLGNGSNKVCKQCLGLLYVDLGHAHSVERCRCQELSDRG